MARRTKLEDGGGAFLLNVEIFPSYTVLTLRSSQSSQPPLWEPQIEFPNPAEVNKV
jgi:hypothetical protein